MKYDMYIPQFVEDIWEVYAIEDGWVSSLDTICKLLVIWEDNPAGFGYFDDYDWWQWADYIKVFFNVHLELEMHEKLANAA